MTCHSTLLTTTISSIGTLCKLTPYLMLIIFNTHLNLITIHTSSFMLSIQFLKQDLPCHGSAHVCPHIFVPFCLLSQAAKREDVLMFTLNPHAGPISDVHKIGKHLQLSQPLLFINLPIPINLSWTSTLGVIPHLLLHDHVPTLNTLQTTVPFQNVICFYIHHY